MPAPRPRCRLGSSTPGGAMRRFFFRAGAIVCGTLLASCNAGAPLPFGARDAGAAPDQRTGLTGLDAAAPADLEAVPGSHCEATPARDLPPLAASLRPPLARMVPAQPRGFAI